MQQPKRLTCIQIEGYRSRMYWHWKHYKPTVNAFNLQNLESIGLNVCHSSVKFTSSRFKVRYNKRLYTRTDFTITPRVEVTNIWALCVKQSLKNVALHVIVFFSNVLMGFKHIFYRATGSCGRYSGLQWSAVQRMIKSSTSNGNCTARNSIALYCIGITQYCKLWLSMQSDCWFAILATWQ